MNYISWIMGLSLLTILVFKGIEFHRALVCRQEAWQTSLVLLSRSLFQEAPVRERAFHTSCRLSFSRDQNRVVWQKVPSFKRNVFYLSLQGTL
jgi:hypothetical protein